MEADGTTRRKEIGCNNNAGDDERVVHRRFRLNLHSPAMVVRKDRIMSPLRRHQVLSMQGRDGFRSRKRPHKRSIQTMIVLSVIALLLLLLWHESIFTTDTTTVKAARHRSELRIDGVQQPQEVTIHRIPRLINDLTLTWNDTMHRPWLSVFNNTGSAATQIHKEEHPPYMILMTNEGWNHPNQTYGLSFTRSKRERELYQAIVNHPHFHPTAWEDILNGAMPINTTFNYYVFPDVMSCNDLNYPTYGSESWTENLDDFRGRFNESLGKTIGSLGCTNKPHKRYDFFKHPLFKSKRKRQNATGKNPNATFVVFNCKGWGPDPGCERTGDRPVSVAARDGLFPNMDIDRDQGLVAPAPTTIHLSKAEKAAIANCEADTDPSKRPLKVAYVGNFRDGRNRDFKQAHNQAHNPEVQTGARGWYIPFHNPKDGIVIQRQRDFDRAREEKQNGEIYIQGENNTTGYGLKNATWKRVMRSTKFALAPRGDNKFSYRFTEALSAGAIPVFHGDGYIFPFRPEIVDWNKCALILPEKDAGQTAMDLIHELLASPEQMCKRRQYCYFEIYQRYMATNTRIINGLVEGLEALARGERKPPAGYFCNKTSIENFDCNPI